MNLLFRTILNREIILPLLVSVVVIAIWKVGENKKWNGTAWNTPASVNIM
jgi:hypothetical protein